MFLNVQKTLITNDCAHTPTCTQVHTCTHTHFSYLWCQFWFQTQNSISMKLLNVDLKTSSRHSLTLSQEWPDDPGPTVTFASIVMVFFENESTPPSTSLSPVLLIGSGGGSHCVCHVNQVQMEGTEVQNYHRAAQRGHVHSARCFTLCAWGCVCKCPWGFSTLKASGASAPEIKEEASCLQLSFCSPLGSPCDLHFRCKFM